MVADEKNWTDAVMDYLRYRKEEQDKERRRRLNTARVMNLSRVMIDIAFDFKKFKQHGKEKARRESSVDL